MIAEIPVQAVPNQMLSTTIGDSNYDIELNTRLDRLYISIVKDGVPIIYNRLCQDNNLISGGFLVIDIDGDSQPRFDGLGTMFKLVCVA